MEAGHHRLELLNVVDGVAVDGGDDPALELADADFVGEGARFDGLDEDAMQTGGCALGEILHGDAEFGGRGSGIVGTALAFSAVA